MKRLIIIVMVILFAVPAMAIAKPALESAEIEVLNKWLGIWKFRTTLKPAAWSLKAKELSGTSKVEWILDKKFQEVSNQSDEHETREIHCYDAPSNKYHKWTFTSDGGTSFWIGSWDEKFSTMEWVYIDFGIGITGKIVDRFTSGVKYESTLVMKDGKGNVLLDIRTEYVRSRKQTR
jgi:hypothetical protein